MAKDIKLIREEINKIDQEMKELWLERLNCSKEVAEYKKENNLPIFDKDRENEVINKNSLDINNELIKQHYINFLHSLMDISKEYQKDLGVTDSSFTLSENINFIKLDKNPSPLIDTVFAIVEKAKIAKEKYGEKNVIDATIGSLCDENGKLVALDSLYSTFKNIDPKVHAKYAQSFSGNDTFKRSIDKFFFSNIKSSLYRKIIATPGGTGAISSTIANLANKGETILVPSIAWSSYFLMAKEFGLKAKTYPLFVNNTFDLSSLKEIILDTLNLQDQVILIINDPCHNPTGYSLSFNEWKELVMFLNTLPCNKRVVLLNDVAYIDYSYDLEGCKKYIELFNELNPNILTIISYSCSKSFTSYGLRLGCAIIMSNEESIVNKVFEAYEKTARSMWSNVNNGAMVSVSSIIENNLNSYLDEKDKYINLLKQRSEIIIKEAKEANLECYPYVEGFFITLKVKNELIDKYHEELMNNNIFTVKVDHGIRIAVCSLPLNKCYGLAKKLKNILNKM